MGPKSTDRPEFGAMTTKPIGTCP